MVHGDPGYEVKGEGLAFDRSQTAKSFGNEFVYDDWVDGKASFAAGEGAACPLRTAS